MSNIVILVTQYEVGGAQKAALTLARYFHQAGHSVTLMFLYDKVGRLNTLNEPFDVLDLQLRRVSRPAWQQPWFLLRGLVRCFLTLRRRSAEAIFTFTFFSNNIGIPIAWLAGVPNRISSQRMTLGRFPKLFHQIDRFVANSPLTTKMTAVSQQTQRYCIKTLKIRPDKVQTIPNGVRLPQSAARSLHSAPLIVITVARLGPTKDHLTLLKAAQRLRASDIVFWIVGDGSERPALEQFAADHALHHVTFYGERRDVTALLAQADLFVLPSIEEGMPNAILEAMASRLPIIATDVGGNRELIVHAQTGLLVSPKDPIMLANMIQHLAGDPAARSALGNAAYLKCAAHFSQDAMCAAFARLLL